MMRKFVAAFSVALSLTLALPTFAPAAPTPSPTPTPTPQPAETASPTPGPTETASPTPGPTETASPTRQRKAAPSAPTTHRRAAAPAPRSPSVSPIEAKYRQLGGQAGALGKPIRGEAAAWGGRYRTYQKGVIYWSSGTGAHAVMNGTMATELRRAGGIPTLGFPTTDYTCGLSPSGCYQGFQKGTVYYTTRYGAHTILPFFYQAFKATGYWKGDLGYPTSSMRCGLPRSGCYQNFQKGTIYYTKASGLSAIPNRYVPTWGKLGAYKGSYGYPKGYPVKGLVGGGSYMLFERGVIYSIPRYGTHGVSGSILARWNRAGAYRSSYGYPTGPQVCRNGVCSQTFSGGVITVGTPAVAGLDSRCLTGRTLCASKRDRKLYWVINGQVQRTFDARFGCPGTPSDNGVFRVFWKSYNHTSTIYETWMPRAMFYNGGEAVHYSQDFLNRGWSGCSGGCVNIRDWNGINWLYNQVRNGDRVVVY